MEIHKLEESEEKDTVSVDERSPEEAETQQGWQL